LREEIYDEEEEEEEEEEVTVSRGRRKSVIEGEE
jgi:hypothetical protein